MQHIFTNAKAQNTVAKLHDVKGVAKNYKTGIECWKHFFPGTMMHDIVNYQKLTKISRNYSRGLQNCHLIPETELAAFLWLLDITGVEKAIILT